MAAATHLLKSEMFVEPKMEPNAILPLSPTASSHDDLLPQGFDELVQHNNNTTTNATSYPRDHHATMDARSMHSASQPDSRISTPAPHGTLSPHFSQYGFGQQQQQHQQQQSMYGDEYTYQSQSLYDSHNSGSYPSLPDDPPYTTPATSPSQRSDMAGSGSAPSSGPRPLASKSRVQKTPAKRKKRDRADKDRVHLDKPLSEMGEEWKKSMLEIEQYVNRSAEVRQQEIDSDRKQPGRIKRPMNSFMLYRKAFQNHTKAYCEHNNHQVVSKVCGASWDQEPEAIRKQFGEWAKLERENHQKAHPGYKFAPKPNKNAVQAKRKRGDNLSDDDASDLESYDWDNNGRSPYKGRRSHTGTPVPEHDVYGSQHTSGYYPPSSHPFLQPPMAMNSRAVKSSYGYMNPNKQMPTPYNSLSMNHAGQYLSANSTTNQHYHQRAGGYVEDVSYHKTPSPNSGVYHHQQQRGGLMDSYPPQSHPALEHTPPPAQYGQLDQSMYPLHDGSSSSFDPSDPLQLPDHSIEASGLDFSFNSVSGGGGGGLHHGMGDGISSDSFLSDGMLQDQHAQQVLRGNEESWDIQPLDDVQGGESFDDWGVDPSLSQPYGVTDPSLSEAYIAQD